MADAEQQRGRPGGREAAERLIDRNRRSVITERLLAMIEPRDEEGNKIRGMTPVGNLWHSMVAKSSCAYIVGEISRVHRSLVHHEDLSGNTAYSQAGKKCS